MSEVIDFRRGGETAGRAHYETPTGARIEHILADSHARAARGAVSGTPGCGKTFEAQRYAETADGAVIVTLTRAHGTQTAFLIRVLAALIGDPAVRRVSQQAHHSQLHTRTTHWSVAGLYEHLRSILLELAFDAMRQPDAPPFLLIVDEAQFADDLCLDHLRSATEGGVCGVVLLGNHELFRPRSKKVDPARFLAFRDRLDHSLDIRHPTEADVAAFLDFHRITSPESRALMTEIGTRTSFRRLNSIVEKARVLSGAPLVRLRDLRIAAASIGMIQEPGAPGSSRRR